MYEELVLFDYDQCVTEFLRRKGVKCQKMKKKYNEINVTWKSLVLFIYFLHNARTTKLRITQNGNVIMGNNMKFAHEYMYNTEVIMASKYTFHSYRRRVLR